MLFRPWKNDSSQNLKNLEMEQSWMSIYDNYSVAKLFIEALQLNRSITTKLDLPKVLFRLDVDLFKGVVLRAVFNVLPDDTRDS